MLRRLKHWLSHRFAKNRRTQVSWTARDGRRWEAYVCDECSVVSDAHMWLGPMASRSLYGEK